MPRLVRYISTNILSKLMDWVILTTASSDETASRTSSNNRAKLLQHARFLQEVSTIGPHVTQCLLQGPCIACLQPILSLPLPVTSHRFWLLNNAMHLCFVLRTNRRVILNPWIMIPSCVFMLKPAKTTNALLSALLSCTSTAGQKTWSETPCQAVIHQKFCHGFSSFGVFSCIWSTTMQRRLQDCCQVFAPGLL